MGKFQLLAGNVIHFMRIIGTVEKNDIIDLSVCCVYSICISVGTESAITCCMVIEFYEIVWLYKIFFVFSGQYFIGQVECLYCFRDFLLNPIIDRSVGYRSAKAIINGSLLRGFI